MQNGKNDRLTHWMMTFVALFLLIGLTGCGPASISNTPFENDDPVSEAEEVVITFSYDEYAYSMFRPLIEAFHEENPTITVQYVPLSTEDYNSPKSVDDRLLMLAKSADTTLTVIRTASLGNYFLDLQPLMDADSAFDSSDFWPGSLSALEDAQGRVLGLPMSIFVQGIFYDKAAFDAANLAYPQPGWTWDDFRSAVATLAQGQGGESRFGYADRASLPILQPMVGYELTQNDGQIDADALVVDLDWYVQLAQEDQILGMKSSDDYWNALFSYSGPPAMWYGSLFEFILGDSLVEPAASDLKAYFEDSAYGFAPFPVDADGVNVNTTPVFARSGVISAGSEHPAEAWKWLTFLSEHWLVGDRSYATNYLNIPARLSVAEAESFWENFPTDVKEAMQYGLEHAWFSSLYSQAELAVLNAVEDTTEGRAANLMSALQAAEAQQTSWPQEDVIPPEIVVDPPQPISDSALTIHFYYTGWSREEMAAIKSAVNYFNQAHEGEFVVKATNAYPTTDEKGYYQVLGKNFDCYLAQVDPEGAAFSNAVLDLTSLMDAEDVAFQQDFNPTVLDSARYEGRLMTLPLTTLPPVVVYNVDLLAQNGLEPPSLDWTFDDFLTDLTTVTSTSGNEQTYGLITMSNSVATTDIFYAGRGVQWKEAADAVPSVNIATPEMVDMMIWLNELDQSGVFYRGEGGDQWWNSLLEAVSSGHVGFWTANAGDEDTEFISGKLSFQTGIAPIPSVSKLNGSIAFLDQLGFYISNASQNPEACWALGKYLTEQTDVLNGIATRTSVANSSDWIARIGAENIAVYQKSIENLLTDVAEDPYGNYLWFPITGWLGQAQVDIANQQDPAQVLAEIQSKSDAYLRCMSSFDLLDLNREKYLDAALSCSGQSGPNGPSE